MQLFINKLIYKHNNLMSSNIDLLMALLSILELFLNFFMKFYPIEWHSLKNEKF